MFFFLASVAGVTYSCLFCSVLLLIIGVVCFYDSFYFFLTRNKNLVIGCFSFLSVTWEFEISQFGIWNLDFWDLPSHSLVSFSFLLLLTYFGKFSFLT